MAIKVWYRTNTNTNKLEDRQLNPAPLVRLQPEFYYANDNVIGYTYNITLTGYAAGKENYNKDHTDFADTITSIEWVRKTFDENGGDLEVWEMDGGETRKLLSAKGALIKSVNFQQSPNYWHDYAQYTIDLEFNEVDAIGCSGTPEIVCSSGIFDKKSFSEHMVDMYKYKIKSFDDGWSFAVNDDNEEFDNEIYNTIIDLNYNISATGKSYYNVANKNIGGTMLPAWEQAKNFVQDKLFTEIDKSLSHMLYVDADTKQPSSELKDLYKTEENKLGMLNELSHYKNGALTSGFKIYDEKIDCDVSESRGTFSASYSCKLKKYNPNYTLNQNSVIHTFNKSINISQDQEYKHSISTGGEINGILPGSIIDPENRKDYGNKEGGKLFLPKNGRFLTATVSQNTKTAYDYAKNYFEELVGTEDDLYDPLKKKLGVTYHELGLSYLPEIFQGKYEVEENLETYPVASSFSVDHKPNNGSISYEATYDSSVCVGLKRGYASISIVRNDPADKVAEFIIPGRAEGPIIQNLNTKSEKTISISINGAHPDNKFCVTADSFSNANLCAFLVNGPSNSIGGEITEIINGENDNWIRTKKDFSVNHIDGSFSINLEFLCVGHME